MLKLKKKPFPINLEGLGFASIIQVSDLEDWGETLGEDRGETHTNHPLKNPIYTLED